MYGISSDDFSRLGGFKLDKDLSGEPFQKTA